MIQVTNLNKSYNKKKVLNDVNFNVYSGEITGLIGQNGAGKSTIFHSILNFISYEGDILMNGKSISSKDFDNIGYLPEERSLYPKLTIEQHILYLARLKNKKSSDVRKKIDFWLKKFDVKGKKTDKIKSLSKGNQQKVQLICTLIHDPKVVILDEPFSGLDPVNSELLKKAILELKMNGSTIIFSSHNMNNVQEICDRIVMLKRGSVVLDGKTNDVRESFGKTNIMIKGKWNIFDLQKLPSVSEVLSLSGNRYMLKLNDSKAGSVIFDELTGGKYIEEFSQESPTLDEIFRRKVEEGKIQ